jgi:hypothetical protein
MEAHASVSERVLPGELSEFSTQEEFDEKCYQSVQEYRVLLGALRQLEPGQRQEESRIACALDRVTGQIRSHIKWAQNRHIETADLERILQSWQAF